MTFTFNLAALLNVLFAVAGLRATLPETRGKPVKLWRLGLPPIFCTVTSIVMLANTPTPHLLEFMWIGAASAGAVAGIVAGSRVHLEVDQMWGAIRLKPSYAGLVAALGVLLTVFADSIALWMGIGLWPPGHDPALGAALLSGFLDGRAWRIAARAVRSPHAELHVD
ncbi:MAG: hypothetical protein JSR24_17315 [Proteobacteria bacterium]|nr:hypothetical protein [Pseudomonadota bacterium]